MRARWFAITICTVLSACATASQRTAVRSTTALRFECNPRDATLIIDEQNQGPCLLWERRALGLGPGVHRVRIERDGYLPHESEIDGRHPRGTLHIQLRERPE
jgi:hypothetical protein